MSISVIIVSCAILLISIYTLSMEIFMAGSLTTAFLYSLFIQFLQNALLFIIGLEIAITLVKHSFTNVIELLIFALVRKILITTDNYLDVAVIVLSIIALIIIRQYIKKDKISNEM
ncbi:MAG: hypothetical protein QME14_04805 [Methanobacteriaceae archaeon]|nr:hypothetical protein [Methanobacteriaceae archaeon]